MKQKNVPEEKKGQFGYGDVWTWTAIDADSKLCVSYMLGLRDAGYATEFMRDVASRLANRVQLTSDGHRAYLSAVEDAFGGEIDYAQLIKIYGAERPGEARYSPAICAGAKPNQVCGEPEARDALSAGRRRLQVQQVRKILIFETDPLPKLRLTRRLGAG